MGEKGNLGDVSSLTDTAVSPGVPGAADPAMVEKLSAAQREMSGMQRAGAEVERVMGAAVPLNDDDDGAGAAT